ncbi:DUF5518 domain-containing protein [Halorubrum sp. HHNYT27]|uniref:DUF5518 domain-containing protein n=1 Tax=Halorubrum sp. HHNYT27 TaxID=3402275 RepID=UPI003EB88565
MVKWMAVLYGMIASFVIGIVSGLGLPFTDATLPVVGFGVSGLIAGGVAGYVADEGLSGGALHGLLATTLGGIVVAIAVIALGALSAGLAGLGVGAAFLVVILASGIPGAVGGAIAGMMHPEEEVRGRPTA